MVYLSRIYTKAGDSGETGLGDGRRVAKDDPRVDAYGTVDELNAVIGMAVVSSPDSPAIPVLRAVQNDLFDVGADLCVPPAADEPPGQSLRVTAAQTERLERAIDAANEPLTPLTSFVLPGGTPAAAWLHLARTVCRRAERAVVTRLRTNRARRSTRRSWFISTGSATCSSCWPGKPTTAAAGTCSGCRARGGE